MPSEWQTRWKEREEAAQARYAEGINADPRLRAWIETATPEQKQALAERARQAVNAEERFQPLAQMEARPLLARVMQDPLLTEAQKTEVLDTWWDNLPDPEEADTLGNRALQNAKDAFFGIEGVGTVMGALVEGKPPAMYRRDRYEATAKAKARLQAQLDALPTEGPDPRRQRLERILQVGGYSPTGPLQEWTEADTEAYQQESVPWLANLAKRDAAFAGLPEWDGAIEGAVALTGQLGGALPSPENVVGVGASNAGRTVLTRFLRNAGQQALENVAINALTEPLVQQAAIEKGVQKDISVEDALVRSALGAGLAVPLQGVNALWRGADGVTERSLAEIVNERSRQDFIAEAKGGAAEMKMAAAETETRAQATNPIPGETKPISPGGVARAEETILQPGESVVLEPTAERGVPPRPPAASGGPSDLRPAAPGEGRPRSLGERIAEDPRLSDPNRVRELYGPYTNPEQVQLADRYLQGQGIGVAALDYVDGKVPDEFANVLGLRLIDEYLAAGNEDAAARIALAASRYGTTQGRLVQQFAVWNRLTPGGALRAAQRVLSGAEDAKLTPEVAAARREIEAALEKPLEAGTVGRLLDELAPPQATIWPKYRQSAAKTLVETLLPDRPPELQPALQELTTSLEKILQRRLRETRPPTAKPTPDRELRRLADLLGNRGRAEEILDELLKEVDGPEWSNAANKRLRRANPELSAEEVAEQVGQLRADAQARLRDADFPQPNAEELNRLVSEQLQQDRIALAEMVRGPAAREDDFWAKYPDELAARLGVKGEEARAIAGQLRKRLEVALGDERARQLAALKTRFDKAGAPRVVRTMTEKLQELDRLGATSARQFADLIDQTLNVPRLTAAQRKEILELSRAANEAKEPLAKLYRAAKLEMAIEELQPRTLGQKLRTARTLAMLLNLKTMIRNVGGNSILAAGEFVADGVAAAFDAGLAGASRIVGKEGKRTKSLPSARAFAEGILQPGLEFREGYRMALDGGAGRAEALRKGFDYVATLARLAAANKFEINAVRNLAGYTFSSRVGRGLEKGLSVALGVPDRAFWWAAYQKSLRDQMSAAAVKTPSPEMLARAQLEAQRAIFQDDNVMSRTLRGLRSAFNVLGTEHFGVGDVLLPFTQVPGSILMRAAEWSPAGFIRAAYQTMEPLLYKARKFDQRAFTEAMSRATLGSGALWTGYWLSQTGVLTDAQEDDPDVEALRRELGVNGYRVNVTALKEKLASGDWQSRREAEPGDLVVSYDWAQPMAVPLAMGVEYAAKEREDALKRGPLDTSARLWRAITSGATTLYEQPLLQGVSGFFERSGYSDPLTALTQTVAQDLPASLVPTAVNQVQQWRDNRIFETRGSEGLEATWARVSARIPLVAEVSGFPPAKDVWGEVKERYPGATNDVWNVFLNPAFVNRVKRDGVGLEVLRLWRATGKGGLLPQRIPPKVNINGQQIRLNNEQIVDMQQWVGRLTRDWYETVSQSQLYAALGDAGKAELLGGVVSDAAASYKALFLGQDPKTLSTRAGLFLALGQLDERLPNASDEEVRRLLENFKKPKPSPYQPAEVREKE